jgi:hypothetical protein
VELFHQKKNISKIKQTKNPKALFCEIVPKHFGNCYSRSVWKKQETLVWHWEGFWGKPWERGWLESEGLLAEEHIQRTWNRTTSGRNGNHVSRWSTCHVKTILHAYRLMRCLKKSRFGIS